MDIVDLGVLVVARSEIGNSAVRSPKAALTRTDPIQAMEAPLATATDVVDEVEHVEKLAAPPGETSAPAALPLTVLEPRPGWHVIDLRELWRYRELLYFLTLRDIKVRYKQTALGAGWAILQPLATMLVFSLFFRRAAGDPNSSVPYGLFVLAGLVPWMFFSNAITQAGQSVVGNYNLVTKIYFPRLLIPLGAAAAGLVDLAVAMAMLLVMMLWYGVAPGLAFLLVPLLTLGLVIAALGVGTLLSALTVAYRDFRYVVPFMVQLWMFATPSIYLQAGSEVSPRLGYVLPLNPVYGLIANFRQAMLGGSLEVYSLAVSSAVSVLLLLGGCLYFRRVERDFADII
jgi:lipopolysaccharide transport system permease protein